MTTTEPGLLHQSVLGGDAHIEPHGVPGTTGRLAAPLRVDEPADLASAAMWVPGTRSEDVHVAFVARFSIDAPAEFRLRAQAVADFRLWVDGEVQANGPLRFAPALPEYHEQRIALGAGAHVLAVHAHAVGVTTRMAAPLPPFVWVTLEGADGPIALEWKCRELKEFARTGLRTSPLLGWLEWQDRPCRGAWWQGESDGEDWIPPEPVPALADVLGPAARSAVRLSAGTMVRPAEVARGSYRQTYPGYRWDDPAVQFLLADLDPAGTSDTDGVWVRYDLGHTRLGSLEFTVRSERDAEVTVAYAERLAPTGMPAPVAALSAGPTRMLQHFQVGPGATRVRPLQALGARWVEVRLQTDGSAGIQDAEFRQRDFLGAETGWFHSGDPLLDRIWRTGAETLRSLAEDSLVDSMRERAEWVGDAAVALDLLRAGWGDYRLVHRTLLHAAAGARPDGLVAGCGPGELLYLGTYAAQWVTTTVELARLEGTTAVLHRYADVAEANLRALEALVDDHGGSRLPWPFVDWGHDAGGVGAEVAVLGHLVRAAGAWTEWLRLIDRPHLVDRWERTRARWTQALRRRLAAGEMGYHAATLAVHAGVADASTAAGTILGHLRGAFPFDPAGRRLKHITETDASTATPYFTSYSMPVLLEAGLGAEVADLWRRGWGWMLDQGATTWWEVFDDRWSQCHHWSGAPTGQLSRFGLGVQVELDPHGPVLRIEGNTLGLSEVSGRVAIPGGWADVSWRNGNGRFEYELGLDVPVRLRQAGTIRRLDPGTHGLRVAHSLGDRFEIVD